jgi:hypothetical protein
MAALYAVLMKLSGVCSVRCSCAVVSRPDKKENFSTEISCDNIGYCGVAPRGRSIERPLLINGYAYLAVSLPDNGPVASNS